MLGVVCLQSSSPLAQKELHGEYLVVWIPADNHLDVPPGCSHQFSDAICEFCHRRTRKLIGGGYERCDTALSLFGIEGFVVWRVIVGSGSVVLGHHSLVLLDVQEHC